MLLLCIFLMTGKMTGYRITQNSTTVFFGNISSETVSVLFPVVRYFCGQCLTSTKRLNSIKKKDNHSLPDSFSFLNNLNTLTKLHYRVIVDVFQECKIFTPIYDLKLTHFFLSTICPLEYRFATMQWDVHTNLIYCIEHLRAMAAVK